MKRILHTLLFLLLTGIISAQDFSVDGYVKLLGTFSHTDLYYFPEPLRNSFPESAQDYQVHNRFNFRWYSKKGWSAAMGMRNQLFWGYQARNMENYGDLLEDPGFLNLSTYWSNENSYLRVFVDRLYFQWENEKVRLRLGRQRINWGVNTAFNPNDLFNQYNYFDFDYEERPGVDALLFQGYTSDYSSIQVGVAPGADTLTHSTAAALFKWNKWKGDWQVLAGYYRHDIAIGGGWAANFLWGSSLKGEFTQFIPIDPDYTEANFTLSSAWEYSFRNSLFVTFSYMFNDNGTLSPTILDQITLVTSELSAKNLFPYKHTLMCSAQYPFTALVSGSLAWIQTPDFSNAYLLPQLTFSITQDLDALLFAQIFLANNVLENNEWGYFSSLVFVRFKYSF